MFQYKNAFSGFSVDDLAKAKDFYAGVLGLKVSAKEDSLKIHLDDNAFVYVYSKPDHQPAAFTMLNFAVDDVDKAVKDLKDNGVEFEHYPGTDEDGVSRSGDGPQIAWFKDPAGNIISVLKLKSFEQQTS